MTYRSSSGIVVKPSFGSSTDGGDLLVSRTSSAQSALLRAGREQKAGKMTHAVRTGGPRAGRPGDIGHRVVPGSPIALFKSGGNPIVRRSNCGYDSVQPETVKQSHGPRRVDEEIAGQLRSGRGVPCRGGANHRRRREEKQSGATFASVRSRASLNHHRSRGSVLGPEARQNPTGRRRPALNDPAPVNRGLCRSYAPCPRPQCAHDAW